MTSINIVKGDRNFKLRFRVRNADDEIQDLTGASILFKARLRGQDDTVEGVCEIEDASNGICYYEVKQDDFKFTGIYDAELEITYVETDKVITCPDIQVLVKEEL